MEPMFLGDIERTAKATPAGEPLAAMEAQGIPVPQIRYLSVYKPELTDHFRAVARPRRFAEAEGARVTSMLNGRPGATDLTSRGPARHFASEKL